MQETGDLSETPGRMKRQQGRGFSSRPPLKIRTTGLDGLVLLAVEEIPRRDPEQLFDLAKIR